MSTRAPRTVSVLFLTPVLGNHRKLLIRFTFIVGDVVHVDNFIYSWGRSTRKPSCALENKIHTGYNAMKFVSSCLYLSNRDSQFCSISKSEGPFSLIEPCLMFLHVRCQRRDTFRRGAKLLLLVRELTPTRLSTLYPLIKLLASITFTSIAACLFRLSRSITTASLDLVSFV